jgi:hypothetical protein
VDRVYEFTACQREIIYGYGTEAEARRYLGWLNRDRDINVYEMEVSNLSDDEADTLAMNLREWVLDVYSIEEAEDI